MKQNIVNINTINIMCETKQMLLNKLITNSMFRGNVSAFFVLLVKIG
jgi:hypothetical protein